MTATTQGLSCHEQRGLARIRRLVEPLNDHERRFVLVMLRWVIHRDVGARTARVSDLIDRHRAGERVASKYFDRSTGAVVAVGKNEPIPENAWPLVGTLAREVTHV